MLVCKEGRQRFSVQRDRLEVRIGGLGDGEDDRVLGRMDAIFGSHGDRHSLVLYVLDGRTGLVGLDKINLRQGGRSVRQFDRVVQLGRIKARYTYALDHQVIKRADLRRSHLNIHRISMRGLLVLGGNGKGNLRRRTVRLGERLYRCTDTGNRTQLRYRRMGRQGDGIIILIRSKSIQQHIVCENLREVGVCIERTDVRQDRISALRHAIRSGHLHVHHCVFIINRNDRVLDFRIRIFGCGLKRIQRAERYDIIVCLAVEIRYRLIIRLHRCQERIVRSVAVYDIGRIIRCTNDMQLVGLRGDSDIDAVQRILAFKIEHRIIRQRQQTSRGLSRNDLFSRHMGDTGRCSAVLGPRRVINGLSTRFRSHGDDVRRIVLSDHDGLVGRALGDRQIHAVDSVCTARIGGFRTGHGQRIVGVRQVLRIVTDSRRTNALYLIRPFNDRHLVRHRMRQD